VRYDAFDQIVRKAESTTWEANLNVRHDKCAQTATGVRLVDQPGSSGLTCASAVPPKYHQTHDHQSALIDNYRHEISGGRIQIGTC